MNLTDKQAYVLANLERIAQRPYKVRTPTRRMRFELDGCECTSQVTSLVVKKKIRHLPGGMLARLGIDEPAQALQLLA